MGDTTLRKPVASDLSERATEIKNGCGVRYLNRDDLLILALEEISRTTTYEELCYLQSGE